jgi:hypothetical protein
MSGKQNLATGPQEAVPQFNKTVIPGEPRNPAPYSTPGWARPRIQENRVKINHSGSLLALLNLASGECAKRNSTGRASRTAGFGRDDEMWHSLHESGFFWKIFTAGQVFS